MCLQEGAATASWWRDRSRGSRCAGLLVTRFQQAERYGAVNGCNYVHVKAHASKAQGWPGSHTARRLQGHDAQCDNGLNRAGLSAHRARQGMRALANHQRFCSSTSAWLSSSPHSHFRAGWRQRRCHFVGTSSLHLHISILWYFLAHGNCPRASMQLHWSADRSCMLFTVTSSSLPFTDVLRHNQLEQADVAARIPASQG